MFKNKFFNESPKTMEELRFRLHIISGCLVLVPLLVLLFVTLIIKFWPVLLVLVITGFSIRVIIRRLRQQHKR